MSQSYLKVAVVLTYYAGYGKGQATQSQSYLKVAVVLTRKTQQQGATTFVAILPKSGCCSDEYLVCDSTVGMVAILPKSGCCSDPPRPAPAGLLWCRNPT